VILILALSVGVAVNVGVVAFARKPFRATAMVAATMLAVVILLQYEYVGMGVSTLEGTRVIWPTLAVVYGSAVLLLPHSLQRLQDRYLPNTVQGQSTEDVVA